MNHDPKIESLAVRMNRMTIASVATVQQAASAHINCLVQLALVDSNGDQKKAAALLRAAMEQMIADVYDPTMRPGVRLIDGRIAALPAHTEEGNA